MKRKYAIYTNYFRGDGQPGLIRHGFYISEDEYNQLKKALEEGKTNPLTMVTKKETTVAGQLESEIQSFNVNGPHIHSWGLVTEIASDIIDDPGENKANIIMPRGYSGINDPIKT